MPRLVFEACRAIESEEELVFDYGDGKKCQALTMAERVNCILTATELENAQFET